MRNKVKSVLPVVFSWQGEIKSSVFPLPRRHSLSDAESAKSPYTNFKCRPHLHFSSPSPLRAIFPRDGDSRAGFPTPEAGEAAGQGACHGAPSVDLRRGLQISQQTPSILRLLQCSGNSSRFILTLFHGAGKGGARDWRRLGNRPCRLLLLRT